MKTLIPIIIIFIGVGCSPAETNKLKASNTKLETEINKLKAANQDKMREAEDGGHKAELEGLKAESKERQRKRLTTMKTIDILCAAILLIAGCMTFGN